MAKSAGSDSFFFLETVLMLVRFKRPVVRRGFTLVELLVVIAIIGVMVGLLLPAVQAAREAARRMSCSNNMKQLGLALHNYHSTHEKFPYSVLNGGSIEAGTARPGDLRIRNHRGWLMLLPFIEQQGLYDLADFRLATGAYVRAPAGTLSGPRPGELGNRNDEVVSTPVSSFLCPSDPNPTNYATTTSPNYSISPGTTVLQGAFTNYDFSVRRTSSSAALWTAEDPATRPLFGHDASSKFRDIVDGTSNVIALGETLRLTWDGVSQTWGYAKWVGHGVDVAYFTGMNWNFCCGWDATPNVRQPVLKQRLGNWSTVGSMHPGGAQFTLGDGSVRFISESIELVTLQRLARIADGQPLGEF